MEDTNETDLDCYYFNQHRDDGIKLQVCPFLSGYSVMVNLRIPEARWWQQLQSDKRLPTNTRQGIIDALDCASTWLCNKGNYHPCCLNLEVTFTPSDKG